MLFPPGNQYTLKERNQHPHPLGSNLYIPTPTRQVINPHASGPPYSLSANTTGSYNTASGIFSLSSNTTGSYNTAFGYNAKASTVNATNQTVIGCEATGQADNSVVLGNEDVTAVYMGEDSGATVYAASFVGDGSQLTGITGSASSLNDLTDVLVDSNSMFLGNPPTNSTGGYNTASGRNALNSNTTGG